MAAWRDMLKRSLGEWLSLSSGQQRRVVLSPDVDGVMSFGLLRRAYPDATLLALYDGAGLTMVDPEFRGKPASEARDALKAALWLDLDACNGCVCIGQHVVDYKSGDEALNYRSIHSFNPNTVWGIGLEGNFRSKYPFGTAHLLADTLPRPESDPSNLALMSCLAVADSARANATKYRNNAWTWSRRMFEESPAHGSAVTHDLFFGDEFERRRPFNEFKQDLKDCLLLDVASWQSYQDLERGLGAIAARDVPCVIEAFETKCLGLEAPSPVPKFGDDAPPRTTSLVRTHDGVSEFRAGKTLEDWIQENRVFSHAFTHAGAVNWTQAPSWW